MGELEPELIRRRQDSPQAFEFYRQSRFPEAEAGFEAILTENPEDGPARVYRSRCRKFMETPPPAGLGYGLPAGGERDMLW